MGKQLTAIAVEKAVAGAARREIPDGIVPGLYLVVQPSGVKSWAFRYRVEGAPKKLTLGSAGALTLKEARDRARSAASDVEHGKDPAAVKKATRIAARSPETPVAHRDVVEKVVHTFVDRYAKPNTRPSSAKEYERVLNKEVVERWRGRRLSSIGRADVHDLLDEIVDRGSPIQANRTLAALRKLCSWAVDRGLIDKSPCDGVKPPAAERSRDRVLSDDELKSIWQACDGMGWPFGPLVQLLMLTGQRRDEVGQLRWSELDLDGRLWILPASRAKNGIEHPVPLSAPVVAILSGLPRIGEFVFSTNGRTPVSGFSKAKLRLDALMSEARQGRALADWIFHDLRRTAATGMARLGVGLPTVERILNHVSGSFGGVAGVYQKHDFAEEKRLALDKWGAFVDRLTAGEPAGNVVELLREARA